MNNKTDINNRPQSWIQGARTNNMPEWIRTNPKAFRLLYEFAERSRREEADIEYNGKLVNLKVREFITGRKRTSERVGISEQEYRNLFKKFVKLGFIETISSTNEFTVAKYNADGIFFNNYYAENPTLEPTKEPTDNQPLTTNNKLNNDNNDKNIHDTPKGNRVIISYKKEKCPNILEGHKGCIEFINSFEKSRFVKFPNFAKQINALHKLIRTGYTFNQINDQIDKMENSYFWNENGFDLMNVVNEIGKVKLNGN